jgi:hypothetical protein
MVTLMMTTTAVAAVVAVVVAVAVTVTVVVAVYDCLDYSEQCQSISDYLQSHVCEYHVETLWMTLTLCHMFLAVLFEATFLSLFWKLAGIPATFVGLSLCSNGRFGKQKVIGTCVWCLS